MTLRQRNQVVKRHEKDTSAIGARQSTERRPLVQP